MKKILLIFFLIVINNLAQPKVVQVVLFTHIEDNTPTGTLGTNDSRNHYTFVRNKMIEMALLAKRYGVKWSFQPDWKILLAALMYENSQLMSNSNGKNFLRYLKEDLNVAIDPHSHESFGFNYTDVACLLDSLGVGGSNVIGGHIWDPNLPQFQNWDRFRTPVRGLKYPWYIWRGDILMGSGTPNHVNDPKISGVWRPKDRFNYFIDDPNGNIFCVGQYKETMESINELIALYENGTVSPDNMLTFSYHILPLSIINNINLVENDIIKTIANLQANAKIKTTDFTTLINDWKTKYNSKAFIYDPTKTDITIEQMPFNIFLYQNYPNPFNSTTTIHYQLSKSGWVTLKVYDQLGKEIETIVDEYKEAGFYKAQFSIMNLEFSSGVYFYRLRYDKYSQTKKMIYLK